MALTTLPCATALACDHDFLLKFNTYYHLARTIDSYTPFFDCRFWRNVDFVPSSARRRLRPEAMSPVDGATMVYCQCSAQVWGVLCTVHNLYAIFFPAV
jgi:hypothetical protein